MTLIKKIFITSFTAIMLVLLLGAGLTALAADPIDTVGVVLVPLLDSTGKEVPDLSKPKLDSSNNPISGEFYPIMVPKYIEVIDESGAVVKNIDGIPILAPDWSIQLPNWEISIDDATAMTLKSISATTIPDVYDINKYVRDASAIGATDETEQLSINGLPFEIRNISPGSTGSSTVKIINNCPYPIKMSLEVGCLEDVILDNSGHPIEEYERDNTGALLMDQPVILARKLDFTTYYNNSPIPSFPNNKVLTFAALVAGKNNVLYPVSSKGDVANKFIRQPGHVELKGVSLGNYSFAEMPAGSTNVVRIDVELNGSKTGNEYQNKGAQFVWIFRAIPVDPYPGPSDDDRDPRPPGGGGTTITDPQPPIGGITDDIPEPPEVEIPDTDVPTATMPKTGEAPLWHSILPGLTLTLLGTTLLFRRKETATAAH